MEPPLLAASVPAKKVRPLRFPIWVLAAGRAAGVDYGRFIVTEASIYSS